MPEQETLVFRIGMQGIFSKGVSNSLSTTSSSSDKKNGQYFYGESCIQNSDNYCEASHIHSSFDNSRWNESTLDILMDGLTIENCELSRVKTMLPNENILHQNCSINLLNSQSDTKENNVSSTSSSSCDQVHQNFYQKIPVNNKDMKCANCDHLKNGWQHKTKEKLESLSVEDLKVSVQELSLIVKEVSEELVPLLQERDSLQDEIDARNIVIEQLLKLTWRQTQVELRPIQMSVVLPSDDDEKDL